MNFKKILRNTLTIKLDKSFGLDIGDRSIEIIELEKVFRFSISTYGRAELPAGIVENGRLIDQPALAERLKKLLKEAKPKKVSANKVVISLPESQVYIKNIEVGARLKGNALAKEIVDKISLSLPINLDKSYWDFIEKPLPDKKNKLIIVLAVPKDIANSYVKFCNSIGLEVISLCVESFSLARTILKSSNRQSLLIDIGSVTTNLSFFDSNDKINLSIPVPVAGEEMTRAIGNKLSLDWPEAQSLKEKYGFKPVKDNAVRPIIMPILEDILKEVKAAIAYYETAFNQKLDDIYLLGGSALLPGIAEEMKSYLGREVQLSESVHGLSLDLLGRGNHFPLYANVIGLGMLGASGEFKDLNLLRKMPATETNSVNRLNLFKLGYLSRVNTVRTVINNKFVLVVMVILIGVIFAVLLQQANNFGLDNAADSVPVVAKSQAAAVPRLSTTTVNRIGTSTNHLPVATSTKRPAGL